MTTNLLPNLVARKHAMFSRNSLRCRKWREKQGDAFKERERQRVRIYRRKQKGSGYECTPTPVETVITSTKTRDDSDQGHAESTKTEDDKLMDLKFNLPASHVVLEHPFTMMIAGPSGSGKTFWVSKLLEHRARMIQPNVEELWWFHGQDQAYHETLVTNFPTLRIAKGLPDISQFDSNVKRLVIVDDLMSELKGDIMSNLFTKGSHHTNSSVIFIVQNLFNQAKEMRDISLNCHYMVIMKNPRDKHQVGVLNSQMFPGQGRTLLEAYEHATKEPHGYLFISLDQKTHEVLRVRTNIFPGEINLIYAFVK